MNILVTIVMIIGLVILGTILNNKFPKIPTALFQVVLGSIFALAPIFPNFSLDNNTFMVLIIAPLLFTDGFKLSRSKFWLYRTPILLMAVALVLVTVIIVGSLIHILLPAIPLSAAFALAAILSPTDAIAVKSITKGMKLPKGLMDILEGESLLNDAAGLVSFNIALAAVLSGTFSLASATRDFIFVAVGGAIFGLILGLLLINFKRLFLNLVGSESSTVVVFQLLTPIFVFEISHTIGVSGIVAVIVTSIIYNLERDVLQQDNLSSEPSLLIESTQTTLGYLLNGFVFVFLGYLLPEIFINMYEYKELTIKIALFYVLLITFAMMVTRFLFVFIFYRSFQVHSFSSFQKFTKVLSERKFDTGNYNRFEYSLIASLSGIHGTITLATAILIPVTLTSGEEFPLRNTILFIASCVVILSMLIGAIFLPLVVKTTETKYLETNATRREIISEVIKELSLHHTPYTPTVDNDKKTDDLRKKQIAYSMVIKKLQEQLIYYNEDKKTKKVVSDLRKLYKKILIEENKKILELQKKYKLKNFVISILKIRQYRRTKLVSYSLTRQVIIQLKLANIEMSYRNTIARVFIKNRRDEIRKKEKSDYNSALTKISTELFSDFTSSIDEFNEVATNILATASKEYDSIAVEFLQTTINNFNNVLFIRFMSDPNSYKLEYDQLKMESIQLQKYRIMTMKKLRHINPEEADIILRDLNYSEALLFL